MYRPGTSLTKAKQNKNINVPGVGISIQNTEYKIPKLEDYVKARDWVGAIAFLENDRSFNDTNVENSMWLAYACFHNGEYMKAINTYDQLMKNKDYDKNLHIYKGCCLYALCKYDEAKREASKGPEGALQNRLQFHIAHKKNDEKNLMTYHHKLQETIQDQLCLSAIHFLRSHHEEAIDIYKKLLLENRELLAINVYVALCYYKIDYYDVSLEILSAYINQNPTSVVAANLKACNQFQLYGGKAAEDSLKPLQTQYEGGGNVFQDNDLLSHNLVVFSGGENALQVLPRLIEFIPEARLNLVIYHLKNNDAQQAFNMIKDLEPTVPREYIIKGVVNSIYGQQIESREHIKTAQSLFQLVGSSASECDTIPGRQCMASCFFLLKQFDDVLVYLKSIRNFFQNDDDFNWNFGNALAATGDFKTAEEAFLLIQNERYKEDECYILWLAKCYIMNQKPQQAWELYMNLQIANESLIKLLHLFANECYRMGHFYFAAKAFDIIQRIDQETEYEEGMRGAVVGVFQQFIAQKETVEHLVEVLNMLKTAYNNPQVEFIIKVVMKWAKENGVKLG